MNRTYRPGVLSVLSVLLWVGLLQPTTAAAAADPNVLHVLNRLSLGPRSGDVARVEAIGVKRYIQEQLSPETIPEPVELTRQLSQFKTLQLQPVELLRQYNPPQIARQIRGQQNQQANQAERQAAQQRGRMILEEAAQARLLRAIESPRQLQEVMVDFWFNHFNVFAGKGLTRVWIGAYEQQAIRPHALGKFRDLLGATARHPAMLFYLDNWQNTAPNSPGARGRFQGLNENYARELMELHTLGVNNGYSQQDVVALARMLTGWGLCPIRQVTSGNGFCFDDRRHDFSDKIFLNYKIQGRGQAEVEQALDILARSPATARHISYKLAQYFVADDPPASLVDRLSQRFLATDGDIEAVLATLFESPEFWNPNYFNAKFKTPYQYVISMIRATDLEIRNPRLVYAMLQQMGMPLYGCQTPDGYKNTRNAWLNPDAMARRLSLATVIATGRLSAPNRGMNRSLNGRDKGNSTNLPMNGVQFSQPVDPNQLTITLGDRFSTQTRKAISESPSQLRAAVILGSPEFMSR